MWENVVICSDWRLVNGDELYYIPADPGQRNNVAEQYPDMVRRLRIAHEECWAVEVERKGRYRFELQRWPKEIGVAINATLPPEHQEICPFEPGQRGSGCGHRGLAGADEHRRDGRCRERPAGRRAR